MSTPCMITLAGGSYRKDDYAHVKMGDTLLLKKEPDNKYDRYAIKLLDAEGRHVGYVANSQNTVAPGTQSAKEIYERADHNAFAVVLAKGEYRAALVLNPSNQFLMDSSCFKEALHEFSNEDLYLLNQLKN